MTWEYMTLVIQLTADGGEVVRRNGERPGQIEGRFPPLHAFLAEQGKLGWELQATIPYMDAQVLFVLKRSSEAAEEAWRMERNRRDRG